MSTDLEKWLSGIGVANHIDRFLEHEIDMVSLAELQEEDLREIGIPMGPRKKILKALAEIGTHEDATSPEPKGGAGQTAEGERRQVTVLFADISGYTKLAAALGEEDTHAMLAAYFQMTDRIVEQFGGRVDKHIGDCVMAVFGAPIARGNDPERAVRAAAEIQKALPDLSSKLKQPIKVHIGIASGQVVASGIGQSDHYTVTGDSVNLASRLTDKAQAGEIYLSKEVADSVSKLSVEPQGALRLKGIDRPVHAFRLIDVEAQETAAQSRPFVGRQTEIQQFKTLTQNCLDDGVGQIAYLRGEAGIGKTRLTEHFEQIAVGLGFKPHRVLILDFGVGKGQDAIGMLVRKLLKVGSPARKSDRLEAVQRAVADGCVEERQAMFLYDLIDLAIPVEMRAAFDAMDNAGRTTGRNETIASLVLSSSQRVPLLIVIEDVHWANDQVLETLSVLGSAINDQRTVMVLTSRIEGDKISQVWRSRIGSTPIITLDLMPLREADAMMMASQFFDITNQFARSCVSRANGNPLFLDQLLRGAEAAQDNAVPDSVRSIVQARMDALSAQDKAALQAASILGQRFSLPVLQHLLQDDGYDCTPLVDKALVRPESGLLLFAHALVREGVYASLLNAKRKELHLRAAAWFADRDLMLRAEHLDRAEDASAADAYLDAAKAQFDALRYEAVENLVRRALVLAKDRRTTSDLNCLLANARLKIGTTDKAILGFEAAIASAVEERQKLSAFVGLATALRIADRQREAMDALTQAEHAARRAGLDEELANIHYIRGNLCFILARIDDCLKEHSSALRLARKYGSTEFEARALSGIADANYMSGKMQTASSRFLDCIAVAQSENLRAIEVSNRHMVGWSRLHLLELNEARQDAEYTKALATEIRDNRALMFATMLLGVVDVEQRNLASAEKNLTASLKLAEAMSSENHMAFNLKRLAILHNARGDLEQATDCATRAYEIVQRIGMKFCGPAVLVVLARLAEDPAVRAGHLEEAEAILDDGCVGHNYFYFAYTAIDDAIQRREWEEVKRHIARIDRYTKSERLAWPDFAMTKAKTLMAWHQDGPGDSLRKELDALIATTDAAGLKAGHELLLEAVNN